MEDGTRINSSGLSDRNVIFKTRVGGALKGWYVGMLGFEPSERASVEDAVQRCAERLWNRREVEELERLEVCLFRGGYLVV